MILDKAKWIWPNSTCNLANQYCQFIQEINIEKINKPKIYISSTSNYVLFVNGEYVNSGQFSDYPNNKSYDVLDIEKYIKIGKNRICVLGYNLGENFFSNIKDTAGIIYAIENGEEEFLSCEENYYRISPSYKNGEIEKITSQLAWTFEYDATKEDDWINSDYVINEDFQLIGKENIQDKTYNFFKRPIKKLERIAQTEPKIIVAGNFIREKAYKSAAESVYNDFLGPSEVCDKISLPNKDFQIKTSQNCSGAFYVIDMGKEVAGFINLEFTATKGTILEIVYGEQLEDLRVRSFVGDRHFGFRIFAKEGENKFTHRLLRLGGRYLQIHVLGNAFIKNAEIIPTDYYAPLKSKYDSVNKTENKINEVAIRTLRICMHEHFEDTPWREQGLYGMDSRNQALCNFYAFADYDFVKACLRTFKGTFKEDGFFEITSPTDFDFTIPSFTFAWIMMIKDYFLYSGDYEFTKEMIPQIEYTLNKVIETIDQTGLIPSNYEDRYWNYIEWSDGLDGSRAIKGSAGDYSLPYNAFFAMAIESMIFIGKYCNIDTNKYENILNNLRIASEKFWDKDKEYFKTYIGGKYPQHYAQLSGALGVLAGFMPQKADVVREKIVHDKSLVECTLSMTLYKYEALLGNKKYGDFVFDEIEKVWSYMIEQGATTFWETIKGAWDFGKAGSWSHAWSAVPLYFYYAYLLGVRPTKPGFEEYIIDPVKKNYIEAEVFTPKGMIKINNK